MRTRASFSCAIRLVLALGLSPAALSAAGQSTASARPDPAADQSVPKLTYRRVFKGSTPEYLSIRVDKNGAGEYEGRKLSDPAEPRPLKLSPDITRQLFELADRLRDFHTGDLESHRKVADLGQKTFIYEVGGQQHSAEFNYTVNRDARDLSDLFEKIAMVEQHVAGLEFAIKYDHLGLPQELREIQIELDNQALADPELLVPTLEEIARNPRFLHLAQARAQDILQRIQNNN
jgi:hypothetical protein